MKVKHIIWLYVLIAGLVVCGVVLFAVFWPRYQTQRLVKRVHSDLLLLARGLAHFSIDAGGYAPDEHGLQLLIRPVPIGMALRVPRSWLPNNATELPRDPFNNHGRGLYGYDGGGTSGKPFGEEPNLNFYILTSYGPDRDQDIDPQFVKPGYDSLRWLYQDQPLELFAYDPTNGLISDGDIYRCK